MPEPTAQLGGELGLLAFKRGFAEWSEGAHPADDGLAHHAIAALHELRAAGAAPG